MPQESSPEEIARSHRWHAVECNNLAWDLSIQPSRTPAQDEEMLHAAHASAFHWAKAGTVLNRVRAKMLLAQVYAALGQGRPALDYARETFDYLAAHAPPDWEIAFAHAILAHAAHAAGDSPLHRQHYARALELGQVIAEPEEKKVFFETFNTIPGS